MALSHMHELTCDWGDALSQTVAIGANTVVTSRNAALGAATFMMSDDADWSEDDRRRRPDRILVYELTEVRALLLDVGPTPEFSGGTP
jgi:hypothetical protein